MGGDVTKKWLLNVDWLTSLLLVDIKICAKSYVKISTRFQIKDDYVKYKMRDKVLKLEDQSCANEPFNCLIIIKIHIQFHFNRKSHRCKHKMQMAILQTDG